MIKKIVADEAPQGYGVGIGGGFKAEAAAERFKDKPSAPKINIDGVTSSNNQTSCQQMLSSSVA